MQRRQKIMTQNSELVLNFLKKNYGSEFSKKQIADTLSALDDKIALNNRINHNLAA